MYFCAGTSSWNRPPYHFGEAQPFFRLIIVQRKRAVNGGEEIVCIVALEGKAAPRLIRFVIRPDRILESACCVDDRDGAHAHGNELRQAAWLGFRRHEIQVGRSVDKVRKPAVKEQIDRDFIAEPVAQGV